MLNIFKNLFRPKLSTEAFFAYFHRLPSKIQVDWFRDSNFIVGQIKAGDHEFKTQGKDAKDFIRMVNDAVYTVFDIPKDYLPLIEKNRAYKPNTQQIELLADKKVNRSGFELLRKKEKELVTA